MCTTSMVMDDWLKHQVPTIIPGWAPGMPTTAHIFTVSPISREEFDALKRDVEALQGLLAAAKKYDEATGQQDCENDEKVALIKKLAKLVGVEIDL